MKKILQGTLGTKRFAKRLATHILKSKRSGERAATIALVGDLGAGKTTFVQGFARTLGIRERMVSPTFLIFRSYPLPKLLATRYHLQRLYHVDLYRIHSLRELTILGFKDILRDPENIVLIEWADRARKLLPRGTVWVKLWHGKREHERLLEMVLNQGRDKKR